MFWLTAFVDIERLCSVWTTYINYRVFIYFIMKIVHQCRVKCN